LPRPKITFDTVRELARDLPGVVVSTAYGAPALKVRGKLMACIPSHRSAEPDSLAVRVDFERRAELLAGAPEVYYLKDHYVGYTAVLVRLSRIDREALKDLLGGAWQFVTGGAARARVKPVRRPRRSPARETGTG
jgi:hypothetical protein